MDFQSPVFGITFILTVGMVAQWIAWKFRIPSILILLLFGIFAGAFFHLLNPDVTFGKLLFPIVSFSVAIILFEGGLELKFKELAHGGKVVRNLVTTGAIITWFFITLCALWILKLDMALSLLLGAILVVTGPTVIGPMLRHIRPIQSVSSILKWEGIVIDPIGAMLAVLVFEVIKLGAAQDFFTITTKGILLTIVSGGIYGLVGGFVLIQMIKRYWLPEFLQNPMTLMMVFLSFTLANHLQHESGLLAVTIMGIVLANQNSISLRRIIEFKESLRVLLISSLFIVLAARLQPGDLAHINLRVLFFIIALILIVRPAVVFLSSLKSNLSVKEKLFISFVAPRGIVAAAIASIFSFELAHLGFQGAEKLAPITFAVIIGTVTFYGLASPFMAKWLQVAAPSPQGFLLIGAQPWARNIAQILAKEGFRVVMCDTNYENISQARLEGIEAYQKNMLSQADAESIELDGVGRLLALTPNDEVNSLATIRFSTIFSGAEVYQLGFNSEKKAEEREKKDADHLTGRFLFHEKINYDYLDELFVLGAVVKKTKLSKDFDFDNLQLHYGKDVLPLCIITQNREIQMHTSSKPLSPKPGQTLISIAFPQKGE